MPFDWMHTEVPSLVVDRNQRKRRAMHEAEIRNRASLLLRLGYDQAYAVRRCMGNQVWSFDTRGVAPLTNEEVSGIVEGVFKR